MRRGDIVTVSAQGDYGKPRPAVVIQGNVLNESANSIIVCLMTSHLVDAPLLRLTIDPTDTNGLRVRSQIQMNRITTFPVARVGARMGVLTDHQMVEINRLLAVVVGLA